MYDFKFDDNRVVLSGNEFQVRQYGRENFQAFIEAFLCNYRIIHERLGTLKEEIDVAKELRENFALQPTSVCLAVLRNGKIAVTLMVTKRNNFETITEAYFGLDLKKYLKTHRIEEASIYYMSKLSIHKECFADKERNVQFDLMKLLLYLTFDKMMEDNFLFAFANIHRISASALQKVKLSYSVETKTKDLRGIKCFGIVVSRQSVDSFLQTWDFDSIISNNFYVSGTQQVALRPGG